MKKRQVLSMMKGIHSQEEHLGEQRELEEHNGVG